MNSVSFSGKTAGAYQTTPPKKTSNAKKGAMIGAGLGVAGSVASSFIQRGTIKSTIEAATQAGLTKNKAIALFAVGAAIGLAINAAVGSLLGGGIGKIVDHFKKPKTDILDTKLAKEGPKEAKVDTEA